MNQSPLILSVSGARGIVGESMTPEVASRFAGAFAAVAKESSGRDEPLIILGRDTRPSGEPLAQAVAQGLVRAGCRVIDLGIVMTPTVGVKVQQKRAAGGMVITASHNPAPWNGLKCLNRHGAAPAPAVAKRIIELFHSRGTDSQSVHGAAGTTSITNNASANDVHLDRVLRALGEESTNHIRAARFRVVLDSINGAGCVPGRMLLESLGCKVIQLNGEPDGTFAHAPEPIEENLRDICRAVKRERAHLGFAQDPDGDRLAIVDEQGAYIGEEYTLALCALRALKRSAHSLAPGSTRLSSTVSSPRPELGTKADEASSPKSAGVSRHSPETARDIVLAANLSTSRMIDDVASMFPQLGARVIRTAVGEANVVDALLAADNQGAQALIGGEGNGGVIYPEVCWVRDSLISMALVLDLLASRGVPAPGITRSSETSLSIVVSSLPRYTMIKRKFDLSALGGTESIAPMLAKVKAEFSNRSKHPDARINDTDGIRIDFADGWVHLRPSNTEPIVRLIAEAPSKEACDALISQTQRCCSPPLAT